MKTARVWRSLWRDRYIYLMLFPVVAYFLVFRYWPMGWMGIAFYDFKLLKGFSGSEFIGLRHFLDFFSGLSFWTLVRNTILISLVQLLFAFPAPLLFALLLNELRSIAFKRFVQTISYLPHFISMVVLTTLVITFLSPSLGTLNLVFRRLGLEPVYFMGDPRYFRTIVVGSAIWQNTGWGSILYLSVISGIDPQLYEAATVDGAGRLKRAWHITLPSLKTTVVILLILQVGQLLNVGFEKIFLLQNPLNLDASEVLSTYVYKRGIQNSDLSFATAIGLFNSGVSLVLVAAANVVSRRLADYSLW
jgi:putative aldouronate transport system permease protein